MTGWASRMRQRARVDALPWLAVTSVFAAAVLATSANLLSFRHYARWDWTRDELYSPSAATLETLDSIREPVEVISLLARTDPAFLSVQQLMQTYGTRCRQLRLSFMDPDANPGAFLALQEELGLRAGRAQDGSVLTEAALVVRRGLHHWFVAPDDLVSREEGSGRVQPEVERALTRALQNVLSDERPVVCFSSGHDEISTDDVSPTGLADLARELESGGRSLKTVALDGPHPAALDGCRLLVLAAPDEPLARETARHIGRYLSSGGSVLALATAGLDERGHVDDRGLSPLLEAAGLVARREVVIEVDPQRVLPGGFGETFVATPLAHEVTRGLLRRGQAELGVVATLALPLDSLHIYDAKPLLVTSTRAFSTSSLSSMVDRGELPRAPSSTDSSAPGQKRTPAVSSTVAWAVELPLAEGAPSVRHPRLVVAPASIAFARNWREPQWAGTRRFAEGAIAWLLAQPLLASIPEKPSRATGLVLTQGQLDSVALLSLLGLPFAAGAVGGVVQWRRRRQPRAVSRKLPQPPPPETHIEEDS
jgi:hypothetical protein